MQEASMTHSNKPLTFAVMLIRAQRRLEAIGKTFPAARAALQVSGQPKRPEGSTGAPRPAAQVLHAAVPG
jgi:hypothetical protein